MTQLSFQQNDMSKFIIAVNCTQAVMCQMLRYNEFSKITLLVIKCDRYCPEDAVFWYEVPVEYYL